MEKENTEKVVQEKKERIFRTRDLVFTAIIAFLMGAIITAGGLTIGKNVNRGGMRDFRQDRVQSGIEQRDFNNGQMNRSKDKNNNRQTPPDMPNSDQNNQNNQNSQNNQQVPNNQNAPATSNNNG